MRRTEAATSRRSLLSTLMTAVVGLVAWPRAGLTQTSRTGSVLQTRAKGVGDRLFGSATPNYAEFDRFLEEAEDSTFTIADLYWIFRDSIEEQQRDEKYFLQKLQELNKIAEAISEQKKALAEKYMDYATARSGAVGKDEAECDPVRARSTAALLDRHLRNIQAQVGQLDRRDQQWLDAEGLLDRLRRDRTIIAKLQKTYRAVGRK